MVEETGFQEWPTGLVPDSDGWFVVNARDAAWFEHPAFGHACVFEDPRTESFPHLGFRLRVLQPGQGLAFYHEESAQEGFLVLAGACTLLVEEEERPLRAWDFFHCPAGTAHVVVGAGDGPAVLLAVGARRPDERLRYPASALAQRHGVGVATETTSGDEAYAGTGEWDVGRPPGWAELPWAE